jgi:nitrite reductase/ring-hydroxylating ferredoxin subunit
MGEDFVKVAETKNIDASQMMAVAVNGEKMGPSNAKGKHYAIGNVCTHMGGGHLTEGKLEGHIVRTINYVRQLLNSRCIVVGLAPRNGIVPA